MTLKPEKQKGRQTELLLALNRAAAAIQRAANSETAVYDAFKAQLGEIGLRGSVGFFAEEGQYLEIRAIANKGKAIPYLEKLTGINMVGFRAEVSPVAIYKKVLDTKQAQFLADTSEVTAQMVPQKAQKFIKAIVKTIGHSPTIFAPMVMEDKVVGLVNISGASLTEADLPVFTAFANHLTIALENAQLFDSVNESVERYQMLVDTAVDGIATLDENLMIREVNQAACRLLGESRENLLGQKADQMVAEDEAFDFYTLSIGDGIVIERNLMTTSGRAIPAEISITRLKNGHFLTVMRDISERKRIETERGLAEVNDKLFTQVLLCFNSGDVQAGLHLILEHVCQHLNLSGGWVLLRVGEDASYQMMCSYRATPDSPEITPEFFGPTCRCVEAQVANPETAVIRTIICARFLQAGERQHVLTVPLIADGVNGMMDFLVRPSFFLPPHSRTFLENIIQSVSLALANSRLAKKERQLNQAIASERQLLSELLAGLPDGIVLLAADQRVILANPAAQEKFPCAKHLTIGQKLHHIGGMPVTTILDHHNSLRPIEVKGEPTAACTCEVRSQRIAVGGEHLWALVMRDVSFDQELQKQVQAQDRLATVGRLAAGIAHDFNNIMAVIVLYADLLLRSQDTPVGMIDRLETIRKQGERASQLIQQILDFSRQSVIEKRPLSMAPFLKELEKMLRRTLPETITTSLQIGEGAFEIQADPTQMQQVVMNLALNARDAMPDGGHLAIHLAHFKLGKDQTTLSLGMKSGNYVLMTVVDNGCGMSDQIRDHIFEPFFTTKEPGKGTGLGLAQVHGIIAQHDGFIKVASEENVGSTFNIYLPQLSETIKETESAPVSTLTDGDQQIILVVEDDFITREAVCAILELMNFKVLVAGNGEEALILYDEYQDEVDLILSDMVMPRMGGLALYDALKQKGLAVKMVLMTGYPMNPSDRERLADEDLLWLQKPMKAEQLSEMTRWAFKQPG